MAYYCQQCLQALNVKESIVISCLTKATKLNKETFLARKKLYNTFQHKLDKNTTTSIYTNICKRMNFSNKNRHEQVAT